MVRIHLTICLVWRNWIKTDLPRKEEFWSILNDEHISNEDYKHAQKIWKKFKLKNMGEYHNMNLMSNILLFGKDLTYLSWVLVLSQSWQVLSLDFLKLRTSLNSVWKIFLNVKELITGPLFFFFLTWSSWHQGVQKYMPTTFFALIDAH